jgi:hypothetical protein
MDKAVIRPNGRSQSSFLIDWAGPLTPEAARPRLPANIFIKTRKESPVPIIQIFEDNTKN